MKLRCISDTGYDPVHTLYIKNFPIKDEIYTMRGRVHTKNGLGYLLEEIENPIMPNGVEPNFSSKRFVPVWDDSVLNESRSAELAESKG